MTNRLERSEKHTSINMDQEQHNHEHELRGTNGQEPEPQPNTQASDDIQDVYVFILRERQDVEDEAQVVESTLVPHLLPQQPSLLPAYELCCLYLLLVASTLAFQLFCLFNPPEATITIIPRSKQVSMTGTVQLGRPLQSITISQAQTVPTTGTGHQNARSATGTLTFYNGQFQAVTIPAGTVFSGARGIPVVTDQEATIPAGNPPSYGQVSMPAHATHPGGTGNFAAYDINHACCATSVLVTNVQPFTGGQNARDFRTVASRDIATAATPLTSAVFQSVNGAFQGELQPQEQIDILPCRPIVTSDHRIGQEATLVTITVSESCRAVAYNGQELATHVTDVLIHHAATQLQAGYSLFGNVRANVTMAAVSATTHPQVFLAFKAQGTWVYGLSKRVQEQIARQLAGKTTHEAVQLLAALPGVELASIRVSGFGDEARLPKQGSLIHLTFLVTGIA